MCGVYGRLGSAPVPLLPLAALMAHRGPDDRGTFVDDAEGVALGQNRLSIIDLSSAGHQPMSNEDQSVVVTFNGEIYNFQTLRSELEAAGHQFHSRTDTEVLVHGYEQWGHQLVDKLCGMFAFAIWDARQKTLFLARDPMGIKPLYYWIDPQTRVLVRIGNQSVPRRAGLFAKTRSSGDLTISRIQFHLRFRTVVAFRSSKTTARFYHDGAGR